MLANAIVLVVGATRSDVHGFQRSINGASSWLATASGVLSDYYQEIPFAKTLPERSCINGQGSVKDEVHRPFRTNNDAHFDELSTCQGRCESALLRRDFAVNSNASRDDHCRPQKRGIRQNARDGSRCAADESSVLFGSG
jgi:hypothetical protein